MMRFRPGGRGRRTINADKARLASAAAAALTGAGILGWFTSGAAAVVWLPVKLLVVPFLLFVQIIG